MKVPKSQLISRVPEERFFATRSDRNAYYLGNSPEQGDYCAVAEDPTVNKNDLNSPLWYLEQYNGVNWTLVSIDDNYALIITNEGLKALSTIQSEIPNHPEYKLNVSAVKIRSKPIVANSLSIFNWTNTEFTYDSSSPGTNPNLIVLDTTDEGNAYFTMQHNISYRINSVNGSIQYIISLDTDTEGRDYQNSTGTDVLPIREYYIGAIGFYVDNPKNTSEKILFAVGNIPNPIYKYTTTATKVGNTVKLYLNTSLSNLGYVSDLSVTLPERNSLPEVVTEEDLETAWDGLSAPYNVFLVDNLYDTGMPALAVRTGDPVLNQDITDWSFFTPGDTNATKIDSTLWASDARNYDPICYYNNKYCRAVGDETTGKSKILGIRVGNSLVYNGEIMNSGTKYKYNCTVTNPGENYKVGDTFTITGNSVQFTINVISVDSSGRINGIKINPTYGTTQVTITNQQPTPQSSVTGVGFTISISSADQSTNSYKWNFSSTWLNKPIYVKSTYDSSPFTLDETETFVGWCTKTGELSAIKVSLDLKTKATSSNFGTTQYATDTQVKNISNQSASIKNQRSVTPKTLQDNYVQKTLVSGNPGDSASNPVIIDTHTKFTKQIVSDVDGVGFSGTAYRAEWADLAEYYKSDKYYPAGTLITIGEGDAEITKAIIECNGIISTKPGYELGEKKDENDLPVALVGKVPVIFSNDCHPHFGEKVYLSRTEPGKASTIAYGKCLGKIIDKDEKLNRKSTIMCSIRISF